MYAHEAGKHILPPMDCKHIAHTVDYYNRSQVEKTAPTLQLVAVAAVLFDLVKIDSKAQHFLFPPVPKCRSATLYSDNPLRGPPLV